MPPASLPPDISFSLPSRTMITSAGLFGQISVRWISTDRYMKILSIAGLVMSSFNALDVNDECELGVSALAAL
jgi:hypothetical protein